MASSRMVLQRFSRVAILLLTLVAHGWGQRTQCGLYGSPPCEFAPVPKGATPPCAGIGKTYCEHVPNYPKSQIRKIIRQLQYDIQVHLVDEVPVEFNDMKTPTTRPDTKYGTPPVAVDKSSSSPRPPSPTYGVPGHQPGRPPPSPSPTYGVPRNAYIPPPPANLEVNNRQAPNYFNFNSAKSNEGAGYVYNKPNANIINQPPSSVASGQQGVGVEEDDSDDKEQREQLTKEEDSSDIKNIQLTTKSPAQEPNFFFSEQFDHPQIPPPSPSTQPYQIIQSEQQHSFHPDEQPFLPNSPPAPFSTAAYQRVGGSSSGVSPGQPQTEPLPTLSLHTQPPEIGAKDYYRYDSIPAPSTTEYNQAEWFRRISRSLNNSEALREEEKEQLRATKPMSAEELRQKKEMLRILFPEEDQAEEEDLIIHFNTQTQAPIGGNRTRTKRQSNLVTNELCESTTQFIEPQAALTRDGEWKYIVNQVDNRDLRVRQLVKVEICATTICSNLCILPQGYSSKCEQKFVQKRLVTLDPSGTNIYTDTFWFPSCCVCTITSPSNL